MIYLDYNATTPLDGRVRNRFLEVLDGVQANAASLQHAPGRMAGEVVQESREQAAEALGVSPSEIVWTSGATEATTIAIFGMVASSPSSSRTILISPTEHKAVIAAAELCERTLNANLVWCKGCSTSSRCNFIYRRSHQSYFNFTWVFR
jgi:cysteine desulfurase